MLVVAVFRHSDCWQ